MRVVSLTCSNTEIVCALGCSHLLVGVDDHSDYPEEVVKSLPRVGPDLGVDVALVTALKPDLVLASLTVPGHEKVVASLQEAGLNYIAPEPVRLNDIYDDIVNIATALNVPERANGVVQSMQDSLGKESVNQNNGPSILIQWWPKPVIAPGAYSWVNDLLTSAGGINPIIERQVKSIPLDDKEVCELNPDAIVISWCGVSFDKYRPEVILRNENFSEVNAVKNKHIYCISEAYLGRPSPRLTKGFLSLKNIVEKIS